MSGFKIDGLRISTRLAGGFAAVLVLTSLIGGTALLSIDSLSTTVGNVVAHPLTVLESALQAKVGLVAMHREMLLAAQLKTPEEAEAAVGRVSLHERAVVEHLAVVARQYLGPVEDVAGVNQLLEEWRHARAESLRLLHTGRQGEFVAATGQHDSRMEAATERQLDRIITFARNKARKFKEAADAEEAAARTRIAFAIGLTMVLGSLIAFGITRSITVPLAVLRERMGALAGGDLAVEVPYRDRRAELGAMARAVQVFKEAALKLETQRWIKANAAHLATSLQAAGSVRDFAQVAIGTLVPLVQGGAGVFYFWNEETEVLELLGSYALTLRRHLATSIRVGEGLVGQCALERQPIILTEVPDDYVRISSGVGETVARTVLVAPALSKGRVLAVIEIASFQPFSADQRAMIDEVLPIIALNLEVLLRNQRTRTLLEQTQKQAEELRVSEEELRAQTEQIQKANNDLWLNSQMLQEQAAELRASEEEMKVQREELQVTNEELAEKGRVLEAARADAETRALERDTANRYKSEFLANMSHELRTPLNSLLILARLLAENEEGTLLPDQVESARVIEESGSHLLQLINDILDLSKVEAGKMEVVAGEIVLLELSESLSRRFRRLAEAKALGFSVTLAEDLPAAFLADRGKIDQILNNLVGNALKFTETGSVSIHIDREGERLVFEIVDTGVGIPAEKIERIFHAFEQGDGSSSRRFGGTGLGLTISRKLAHLIGGDVTVVSTEGAGSHFTFSLALVPVASSGAVAAAAPPAPPPPLALPAARLSVEDDRDRLDPRRDEIVLVIEDDLAFARIVRDLARKRGFKCLIAGSGSAGLALARRYRPTGIVLDVGLPDMDGWQVMEQLKRYGETRHIPVHFMSALESGKRGLDMGAVGFMTKPVSAEQVFQAFERIRHFAGPGKRRLLLVDDDPATRKAVMALLAREPVEAVEAGSGEDALARLAAGEVFDCMILDLGLPGIGGLELLKRCAEQQLGLPPVVVYSGRDLSDAENLALREFTDSIVIKGVRSPERLLDEVTLFLHAVRDQLSEGRQKAAAARDKEGGAVFNGETVLVVDDDMRNAFALSKVLRNWGLKVLMAQDGRIALDRLAETGQSGAGRVDLVLMDIMMPGMDGYECMGEIRKQPQFAKLPVIALTAKAMVGDREKCLASGADEYVSKPVATDLLLEKIKALLPA